MRKRSLILAVMLIGSLFSNSVFAADEENWDWVSGDRSEKLGTLGEYVVKGNCDSDVPWAFWCGCTVETEGNAKLTFKSRGTAYYKKLTSHTVSVGATAVTGSVHVTSSGVEVDAGGSNSIKTYKCSTSDWDFKTRVDGGRLTSVKETFNIQYNLKKKVNNKSVKIATVDLDTFYKWGF